MSPVSLTPPQLRRLQLIQLEMLLEADRVCRKYGIRYSLAGGTLLGAVRHGGYIPWDDDSDIVLLRPEYEKFREAFAREADADKFYFQDQENTPGYRWGYGKIRRKGTLFVRDGQEFMPYGQEINIDVFPLDNVPDGVLAGAAHKLHCWFLRKVLWSEVGKHTDRRWLVRGIYALLSRIPPAAVFEHLRRLAEKYNARPCKGVRPLTGPLPKGCLYEGLRQWYEIYEEIMFEGHRFLAIREAGPYLKRLYGDYMTLPPEEARLSHPASQIKLIE